MEAVGESETESKWLDQLNFHKTSRAEVFAYLEYIQAPLDRVPPGLLGVCEVVVALAELGDFDELSEKIYQHANVARYLLSRQDELTSRFPPLDARRHEKAKTVLHGLLVNHPVYCLLYFTSGTNTKAFLRFQQALLSGVYFQGKLFQPLRKADIDRFCLGVRKLSDQQRTKEWLEALDYTEMNSIERVRQVVANRDIAFVEIDQFYRESHLFLDVLTNREVTRRDNRGKVRISSRRIGFGPRGVSTIGVDKLCEPLTLGDEDDTSEPLEIYSLSELQSVDNDALEQFGVELEELRSNFEFLFTPYQEIPAASQVVSSKLKAQGAIKRIERQNQFLPLSTQSLTSADFRALASLLSDLDANGGRDRVIGCLIRVMLLTSSSLERAAGLVVLGDFVAGGNSSLGVEGIGFDCRSGCWLIPAYQPRFATPENETFLGASRSEARSHIRLPEPMHAFFIRAFDELLCDGKSAPFRGRKFLARDIKEALSRYSGHRLTLARIERALLLHVAGRHEATMATYLFGHYLAASSARAYYTAPSESHLQEIYGAARGWLRAQLADGLPRKKPTDLSADLGPIFGARYCPTTCHVKSALSGMIEALVDEHHQLGDKKRGWIEYHNLYTAVMIYVQGYLTGIRSVIDPFIGLHQIIEPSGIAVFRDKDGENQFHTRTIPVHPELLALAHTYRLHRIQILQRLCLINPKSAQALRAGSSVTDAVPETFLLDQQGRWEVTRPSRLAAILAPYTPLPLNSNRKYLRTRLLEIGLDPHAIDTLLGHASRGEPFWHSASTRSFRQISRQILDGLDLLIKELALPRAADLRGLHQL